MRRAKSRSKARSRVKTGGSMTSVEFLDDEPIAQSHPVPPPRMMLYCCFL